MYKHLKIVIEGNVGCGKSTLLSNLNNVNVAVEPVEEWYVK